MTQYLLFYQTIAEIATINIARFISIMLCFLLKSSRCQQKSCWITNSFQNLFSDSPFREFFSVPECALAARCTQRSRGTQQSPVPESPEIRHGSMDSISRQPEPASKTAYAAGIRQRNTGQSGGESRTAISAFCRLLRPSGQRFRQIAVLSAERHSWSAALTERLSAFSHRAS